MPVYFVQNQKCSSKIRMRGVIMADNSKKMLKLIYNALSDKKGEDIKIIDISQISILADYFIIVNGNNSSQLTAMVDEVEEVLAKNGYHDGKIEGIRSTEWILMDYGNVVIHIFSKEARDFYDIERIWRDGVYVDESQL